MHLADALAAPAPGGLEHEGVADLGAARQRLVQVRYARLHSRHSILLVPSRAWPGWALNLPYSMSASEAAAHPLLTWPKASKESECHTCCSRGLAHGTPDARVHKNILLRATRSSLAQLQLSDQTLQHQGAALAPVSALQPVTAGRAWCKAWSANSSRRKSAHTYQHSSMLVKVLGNTAETMPRKE